MTVARHIVRGVGLALLWVGLVAAHAVVLALALLAAYWNHP